MTDVEAFRQRVLVFEQSLGVLVKCALEHVEAVQTTDLPELIDHVAGVLANAASSHAKQYLSFERTQEVSVLTYLVSVMKRIEQLGEDRLMPLIMEKQIVAMVIVHLHSHHTALKEGCEAGAHFLALAFDTEDYPIRKGDYLPAQAKSLLPAFKEQFLNSLTTSMEDRRKLRPLLDEVQKA